MTARHRISQNSAMGLILRISLTPIRQIYPVLGRWKWPSTGTGRDILSYLTLKAQISNVHKNLVNSWPEELKTVKCNVFILTFAHIFVYLYLHKTAPIFTDLLFGFLGTRVCDMDRFTLPADILDRTQTIKLLPHLLIRHFCGYILHRQFTARLWCHWITFSKKQCTKELIRVSWCIKVFKFNTYHCVKNHRRYKSNKS